MAKKYYAVRKGRARGVFFTWEECKAQVDGVSGAEYKSFSTIEEANLYLSGKGASRLRTSKKETCEILPPYTKGVAIAYVDGSYNPATHEFSCGAILFYEGVEVRFSEKYSDPELCEMRNVAGELMGSKAVISYCLENNIPALEVHHDYEGVSKWALGQWKANKPGTRAYVGFCHKAMETLKLTFIKVKGHSGDKYNDEADSLAKKALGIK